MKRKAAATLRALILFLGLAIPTGVEAQPERVLWTDFTRFEKSTNSQDHSVVWTSPIHHSTRPWTQALVSWNAQTPGESGLEFQIQAGSSGTLGKFFSLGRWAEQTNLFVRSSPAKQTDLEGEVQTDTFQAFHPADSFRLQIVLHPTKDGRLPRVRVLHTSLSDPSKKELSEEPLRKAWGAQLKLPERSQHAYPKGISWCSPTSVTMVMGYWGEQLHRPELNLTVPQVAEGVFDPGWNGTGNWSFNTAFVGSFPSLRAAVIRFNGMRELEESVLHHVPVIISVSLNLLRGRPVQREDGHLVVVVGFTENGDVWIHDPDTTYPPVPGKTVRRIYRRGNVDRAWASSHRTSYVIEPDAQPFWLKASSTGTKPHP